MWKPHIEATNITKGFSSLDLDIFSVLDISHVVNNSSGIIFSVWLRYFALQIIGYMQLISSSLSSPCVTSELGKSLQLTVDNSMSIRRGFFFRLVNHYAKMGKYLVFILVLMSSCIYINLERYAHAYV